MKTNLKSQQGYALVTAIIGLLLMSILGVAILGITTANYKMVKMDGKSQSAYYIAESGTNYIIDQISIWLEEEGGNYSSNTTFFLDLENEFIKDFSLADKFEDHGGASPKVDITISKIGTEGDRRDYKVESIGRIGNSRRKVSTVFSLEWNQEQGVGSLADVFVYSPGISYKGDDITGNGTIVIGDVDDSKINGGFTLEVSNIYIDGKLDITTADYIGNPNINERGKIFIKNGATFKWVGNVYGEIHVVGTFQPGGTKFHEDIYVDGDVNFNEWTENNKLPNIYYTGRYTGENKVSDLDANKLKKVSSVPSFEIPIIETQLRERDWYDKNNYKDGNNLPTDESGYITLASQDKIFSNGDIGFKPSNTNTADNIVIISKGDINITGWFDSMKGVLVSTGGKVYINQGYFDGIIITKEGFYSASGGSVVKELDLDYFFNSPGDVPFIINPTNGDSTGSGGNFGVKLEIKTPIREE